MGAERTLRRNQRVRCTVFPALSWDLAERSETSEAPAQGRDGGDQNIENPKRPRSPWSRPVSLSPYYFAAITKAFAIRP
jgi:hypothetical protein